MSQIILNIFTVLGVLLVVSAIAGFVLALLMEDDDE